MTDHSNLKAKAEAATAGKLLEQLGTIPMLVIGLFVKDTDTFKQLQSELTALKAQVDGAFEGQASALRWASSYAYSDEAKREILTAADNAERGKFDTRPTKPTEAKLNDIPFNKMNVEIDYTNWRGERRKRIIYPQNLTWGLSEYHPGSQWLLLAVDGETKTSKEFAMSGIHSWTVQARDQSHE